MMYDIHSHILPCIDDGSQSIEQSIKMAKLAGENGIKQIICTPHYIEGEKNTDFNFNKKVLDLLNNELRKNEINIELFLGNEVFITTEILNLLDKGEITTLNKSRYILIELPRLGIPLFTEELIFELRLNGIIPIIAHPERNIKIMDQPNILYNFIQKGALAQLNIPSLEGKYGQKIKTTTELLLEHKLIHFVGTDAHSISNLSGFPHVKLILSNLISKSDLETILYINPEKIIKNENLTIKEPKRYIRRRMFSSLFR